MIRARPQAAPTVWSLAALAFVLVAPPGAAAQSDRELLYTCLDTFEGPRRAGGSFTREYGRHVLYCNFTVDILDEGDRRRAAYERWRTEIYRQGG